MGQGADDMDMEWARAVPVRAPWPTKDETIAELVEALRWYGEVGRLARLITREGDAGRAAISADGGQRAAAALAKIKEQTK